MSKWTITLWMRPNYHGREYLSRGCWRGYLGLWGWQCEQNGGNCIKTSFTNGTPHKTLLGWRNKKGDFGEARALIWEKTTACSVLMEKPGGKRPLERIRKRWKYNIKTELSGFGGLQVACWPLVHKFAGSNPTEAIGIFRAKNKTPQHAFLRRGSKAVCPMS